MNHLEYNKLVGLKENQMFTKIADRFTVRSSRKIDFVVLHTTANIASAKNEALNINNNYGTSSFHAVVDEFEVYETVRFKDIAHHAGNWNANTRSLGFELCEKNIEKGYVNYVKYVGFVMFQEGLFPSETTIKFHNEFMSTSCGAFLRNKGKKVLIEDIAYYYNIAKTGKLPETNDNKVGSEIIIKTDTPLYDYDKGVNVGYVASDIKVKVQEVSANGDLIVKFRINKDSV